MEVFYNLFLLRFLKKSSYSIFEKIFYKQILKMLCQRRHNQVLLPNKKMMDLYPLYCGKVQTSAFVLQFFCLPIFKAYLGDNQVFFQNCETEIPSQKIRCIKGCYLTLPLDHKGSFINYVKRILDIFDHPPTPCRQT